MKFFSYFLSKNVHTFVIHFERIISKLIDLKILNNLIYRKNNKYVSIIVYFLIVEKNFEF
jgi:hypothetical protein